MSDRTCSLPECERKHRARGFCKKHYYALVYEFPARPCRAAKCENMTTAKSGDGLCEKHYARARHHDGELEAKNFKPSRDQSAADVLWLRSEMQGDCVLWTGALNPQGYPLAVQSDFGHTPAYRRLVGVGQRPHPRRAHDRPPLPHARPALRWRADVLASSVHQPRPPRGGQPVGEQRSSVAAPDPRGLARGRGGAGVRAGGDGVNWATSDRRARLPDDWAKRVAAVKRRAKGRCEDTHHAAGCDGKGRDVDHIKQGDDHSLANLQLLSRPCHERKTRLDNGYVSAIAAPTEQHPGRLG